MCSTSAPIDGWDSLCVTNTYRPSPRRPGMSLPTIRPVAASVSSSVDERIRAASASTAVVVACDVAMFWSVNSD